MPGYAGTALPGRSEEKAGERAISLHAELDAEAIRDAILGAQEAAEPGAECNDLARADFDVGGDLVAGHFGVSRVDAPLVKSGGEGVNRYLRFVQRKFRLTHGIALPYIERMDQQLIVFEIDRRARGVGLRMGKLCKRAGVSPSTPSRWKAGTPPNLATLKKLTDELDRIEAAGESAAA